MPLFIIARNLPLLCDFVLVPLEFLGRHSLEMYLLQVRALQTCTDRRGDMPIDLCAEMSVQTCVSIFACTCVQFHLFLNVSAQRILVLVPDRPYTNLAVSFVLYSLAAWRCHELTCV